MSHNTSEATTKKSFTHRLYSGETSFDFVGRAKLWLSISAVIVLAAMALLTFRGLNLGIEFRGGADFSTAAKVTPETIGQFSQAVKGAGVADMEGASVLTVGDNTVRVQTRSLNPDEVVKVRSAIAKQAATGSSEVTYSLIGASWGKQITDKGIQALAVFLVLVSLMIWAYFRDWKMSVAALVALAHDLLLVLAVYSALGFTVTPSTLTGVLTILGYSLYDTVVVFDKVRENVHELDRKPVSYSQAANLAVNQVLVRSINTSVIGVLPVAALLTAGLFWLHGGPLVDLGLALFVGMLAGAYSSIFIATPLLAWLREREPAMADHRARLARRQAKHNKGATSPVQVATAVAEPVVDVVPPATAPEIGLVPQAPTVSGERRQPQRNTRANRKK